MKTTYHILNGDSLKDQFPSNIEGEIIVARECLVDGEVSGNTLEEFFSIRATFISELYGDYSQEDYYSHSVSEFHKIQQLPENTEINLWFEDDLFCQVNFWFIAHLIVHSLSYYNAYLIRPATHTQYGFGGLNKAELVDAFTQKTLITELDKIASLWNAYKNEDTEKLLKIAHDLTPNYPFILEAVKAHIDRIPTENSPGRPTQTLIEIMNELQTTSFGAIFKEFSKRESIYGFGDVQVKRLFDNIK